MNFKFKNFCLIYLLVNDIFVVRELEFEGILNLCMIESRFILL